ncbi:MAG TPA: DNA phosphorothioation-associated putative methyltransferase, partial [Candidatus Competibacteraceae bacterium]|nr:DNA phosphorothioation-associated putative methyltransferase [Candidatus Competibacteraceae bacterium]
MALDARWADDWAHAEHLAGVQRDQHYNLIRMDADGRQIALLHYPDFFDEPFPALRESWLVHLDSQLVSYRSYADSLNPPILHRKELLLAADHPRRAEYAALTATAEALGLFDHPTRIGYQRQWLALVREKGYRIAGHALLPLGNEDAEYADTADTACHADWQAARHLTALVRDNFSAPIQSLARYGLLDGRFSLFDYGCGRGDDLRGLRENGLNAAGWDPYYAPEQTLQAADIVNLGFVINVIEDRDARLEALTRAWSLAERLLVVAVMLANPHDPRGQPFRDGVRTQRGTFQKYYTAAEIQAFLHTTLDQEPIPVAPGVLYVFRDADLEQHFLLNRYRSRRSPLRSALPRHERPPRTRSSPAPRPPRDRLAERYAAYREPLE